MIPDSRPSTGALGGRPLRGRAPLVACPILAAALILALPAAVHADADPPKKPEPQATPAPVRKDPPLRFNDDDLEKYHRTAPADDEEKEGAEAPPATPTATATSPAKKPAAKPAAPPKTPPADPLKTYHDRDAMEKFRAEEVQGIREKIARAQERLDYLKAKKDALETPPTLMQQGRTVGQDKQTIPPASLKPGTIFPGGKPHDGYATGIFPPIPPPQTDEDKEKDKTLKPKELLNQTNEEIAKIEEELDDLKKQLAGVETRSQREAAAH